MATKSNLLSTINGYLTAVITYLTHRSSMSAVVDEIYPNSVTDSESTETYTTKSGTNLDYSITIHKQGNQCLIKVNVTNNLNYTIAPQGIFAWKSNEFKPKATINNVMLQAWNGANHITLYLTSGGIVLNSSMPALSNYSTNFEFYIAQD